MELTSREAWTVLHGMMFGAVFLLAFGGGLAGLYSMKPEWVTVAGMQERLNRMRIGMWVMAVVAWLTVITGTFIVYPWYRAPAPKGTAGAALLAFPRNYLLSSPSTAEWH